MYKRIRWILAAGIFTIAVAFYLRLVWTGVPSEIKDPLCPTALMAMEDRTARIPNSYEEGAEELSFDGFCVLVVEDHANLERLFRAVTSSEEDVTVTLFAYFKGFDGPVLAEKKFPAPFLAELGDPIFSDGMTVSVRKDAGQMKRTFVATFVFAGICIFVVLYPRQIWDVLNS